MKTATRILWHIIRYTTATCISTVVSAALPLVAASVPVLMAVGWVLAWGAAFVFYIVTGEPVGIEMDEPLGIVLVPFLLLAFGIFAVSIVLLLATGFSVLAVLPISLITELVCWQLSIRSVILRLGSFLTAGLFLGVIIVTITAMIIEIRQIPASSLVLLEVTLSLLMMCVCAVFVSGITLTTLSLVKDKTTTLGERTSVR